VSQENVELARRLVRAFNDRDYATVESTVSDDYVMRLIGGFADLLGTECRGAPAAVALMRDWVGTLDMRIEEPDAFRQVGDRVLAIMSAEASGVASRTPAATRAGYVFSFRDGRVSRLDAYYAAKEALEAVGLEE
jgi:ketosteroid isomerase-like protein